MPHEPNLALHHLAVVVRDLDQAEAFYSGVLFLPVLRRWEDESGKPRSVWLALGKGAFLAVERSEQPSAPSRQDTAAGFHCVALSIRPDERETWRKRLENAGFPVFRESPFTLYTRDPDANIIAFSHFPDPAQPNER